MNRRRRKEAAKRELERVKNLELTGSWSIEGFAHHTKNSVRLFTVNCRDIDDEPTSEFELICQQADDTMRPFIEQALEAYKKRLENIALNG